jgi:hypothetical protein
LEIFSYLGPVDAANMRFGLKPPFSAETAHSKLEAFDPKPEKQPETSPPAKRLPWEGV